MFKLDPYSTIKYLALGLAMDNWAILYKVLTYIQRHSSSRGDAMRCDANRVHKWRPTLGALGQSKSNSRWLWAVRGACHWFLTGPGPNMALW
ncbi:uncharacterized protein FPRO_13073 [Fusarium proliferatum ET1]|uniref:Uncharacterized protein n=1 Tax=Fusarium proliferatum (strain ET1) TaxID=1227346 RepID=A0A1L7W773_FUSPR|nr:uncharacterized protein FPRO_13073 [Fusarium proliferatum ET1]CZR48463.1 uncharacterized protein FPRO_13073 [Fusarium proliferatum ET1]